MKRIWLLVILGMVLTGCGSQPVLEQVEDVYQAVVSPAAEILLDVPAEGSVTAMGNHGENRLYVCDGYTISVQTFAGGDLDRTLREMTGFSREKLSAMETREGDLRRLDGVWTCTGETGDQVGRFLLLDDGNYHYTVSLMTSATDAGNLRLAWDTILESVSLDRTGTLLPDTVPDTP